MKFATTRPYGNPGAAARKLTEIANSVEAVQDGRIHIELPNGPFLFDLRGTPAEYSAGLKLAIERGWLVMHESGTFVKFTQAGAELLPERPPTKAPSNSERMPHLGHHVLQGVGVFALGV
jgi:hypothetical protein